MPWADSDKIHIAKYLGYSLQPIDLQTVQLYQNRILDEGAIELIQSHLRDLIKLDSERTEGAPYAGSSFRSGNQGSTQYFRGERRNQLVMETNTLIDAISEMLGLPIRKPFFARGAEPGRTVRG